MINSSSISGHLLFVLHPAIDFCSLSGYTVNKKGGLPLPWRSSLTSDLVSEETPLTALVGGYLRLLAKTKPITPIITKQN